MIDENIHHLYQQDINDDAQHINRNQLNTLSKYEKLNIITNKLERFNINGWTGDIEHFTGLDGSNCFKSIINNNPLSIIEMYGIEQIYGNSFEEKELNLKDREIFWQTNNCTIYHGLNGIVDWHNLEDWTRDIPKIIKKPRLLFNDKGKLQPKYSQIIQDKIQDITYRANSFTKHNLFIPNYIKGNLIYDPKKRCNMGHKLCSVNLFIIMKTIKLYNFEDYYSQGIICDLCNILISNNLTYFWHCWTCSYDTCDKCYHLNENDINIYPINQNQNHNFDENSINSNNTSFINRSSALLNNLILSDISENVSQVSKQSIININNIINSDLINSNIDLDQSQSFIRNNLNKPNTNSSNNNNNNSNNLSFSFGNESNTSPHQFQTNSLDTINENESFQHPITENNSFINNCNTNNNENNLSISDDTLPIIHEQKSIKKKKRRANIEPVYYPPNSNTLITSNSMNSMESITDINNCNDNTIYTNNNNIIENITQIDNEMDRIVSESIQISNEILSNSSNIFPNLHQNIDINQNINNNSINPISNINPPTDINQIIQTPISNFNNNDEFLQELNRTFQPLENTNLSPITSTNNHNTINNNNANAISNSDSENQLNLSNEINDVFNNISSIFNNSSNIDK